MNQSIADHIAQADSTMVSGIKLCVPELFADPGFQDYVNSSHVMTWHHKKGPIIGDDWADVAVFVDPSMSGEGTDSDLPYWDAIVSKLKSVVGNGPFTGNHFVVILTNVD